GSMWLSFNVSGLRPVLLHPETGESEAVSFRMRDGRTQVKLDLGEKDAVFVLFDEPTIVRRFILPERRVCGSLSVDGAWTVSFQQGRGAPESIQLAALESLSDNSEPGVKYFSGTSSYSNNFEIEDMRADSRYVLCLGRVCSMARVRVNGVDCGLAWKNPFDVDVTSALRPGVNTLEIEVTNGWINRLIGDAQPGSDPITWAEAYRVSADDPLHPSGLLGPVILQELR
ncbi:MAG: hypothetical protein KBS67_03745, partial [Bacteroidales bacterium]|nr:hypothetical protein [Candidatus Cryptobacteroides equifaecalis]